MFFDCAKVRKIKAKLKRQKISEFYFFKKLFYFMQGVVKHIYKGMQNTGIGRGIKKYTLTALNIIYLLNSIRLKMLIILAKIR